MHGARATYVLQFWVRGRVHERANAAFGGFWDGPGCLFTFELFFMYFAGAVEVNICRDKLADTIE